MKPRRGQASIIGSILFFALFAAAMAGVAYYASSQSSANAAVGRAQSLVAEKNNEFLQYGALSNGSLTIQNAGVEASSVIEVIIKYANGTVYSASLSTPPIPSNNALQVSKLVPSSLQSRYGGVLNSTNPGDEVGLVTSRGNTVWLKPAVAVQSSAPGTTVQMTFSASGDSTFGTNPVLAVDGASYTYTQLPVTLTWFVGTHHTYAWQTLSQGAGTRVSAAVTGFAQSTSGSVAATSTGTIYASFTSQYLLIVNGCDGLVYLGSPSSDGWYDSGSSGQFTCSYVWNSASGARQDLYTYSLDGSSPANVARSGSGTYTSTGTTMAAPHTVTMGAVTQYQLTVSGGNGIGYSLPSQTGDGWYDAGSPLTLSSNYVWNTVSGQSRQDLTAYTLDGLQTGVGRADSGTYTTPTLTMSAAHTLTFDPTTQFYLTVTGGTGASAIGSQTADGWYDAESSAEAESGYSWSAVAGQSRQNLYSYTVDSGSPTAIPSREGSGTYTTPSVAMNAFHTLSFDSIIQFYLSVVGGGGVVYPTSQTSDGWFDSGTLAQVTTSYVWNQVNGQTRQDLASWNLDGGTNTAATRSGSGALTLTVVASMTTYHTVNFNGVTQYYLSASGGDGVAVTGSQTGDAWFDSGSTGTATTNYVWGVTAQQSRSNLVSYTIDSATTSVAREGTGTFATPSILMNTFHTIDFNSLTQYFVTTATSVPSSGSTGALSVSYSYRTSPITVSQALSNPGFESGSLGGWTSWTSYNEVVTSPVHSGSYSAGLSSDGSTGGIISQDISLPSGSIVSSVYMSMWYYIPTSDPSDVAARMYPQFCSSAQPSGTTKGAWTQLTFSWSGSCSTTAGEPWFIGGDASPGVYSYVDDTTVSYTYTYPVSGSVGSSSNSFSVLGSTVTYSYGVGYNFPGGSSSPSWSASFPSTESYSSNNCSGSSVSGSTISGTGSPCTLTTTYSGSDPSSAGASPTGDGWYDSGSSVSVSASASGPFAFSSWSSSSSGLLPITSATSASTTVAVNTYGTVTANFNVNQ